MGKTQRCKNDKGTARMRQKGADAGAHGSPDRRSPAGRTDPPNRYGSRSMESIFLEPPATTYAAGGLGSAPVIRCALRRGTGALLLPLLWPGCRCGSCRSSVEAPVFCCCCGGGGPVWLCAANRAKLIELCGCPGLAPPICSRLRRAGIARRPFGLGGGGSATRSAMPPLSSGLLVPPRPFGLCPPARQLFSGR
jgi:hypothetical protein